MKLLIELSEDTLNNILWHGLNISPHHEKELLNAIRKPLSFKEPKQGEFKCTECHRTFSKFSNVSFNYCPHCGREVERR